MTSSFTPGNGLQGINNNPQPTVLNFYQENIPRGIPLNNSAYWRSSTESKSAELVFGKTGPFTFIAGLNDSLTLKINNGLLQVLEFDPRTYTTFEMIELLQNSLPGVVIESRANDQIVIRTLGTGNETNITVVHGNSVLGLDPNTFNGANSKESLATPLNIIPSQTQQTQIHLWKQIGFFFTEDFELETDCLVLVKSRHFVRLYGQVTDFKIDVLGTSRVIQQVSSLYQKNWFQAITELRTPIKVDGVEKDSLSVSIIDRDNNLRTDGVRSGELTITLEGWSVERARF